MSPIKKLVRIPPSRVVSSEFVGNRGGTHDETRRVAIKGEINARTRNPIIGFASVAWATVGLNE